MAIQAVLSCDNSCVTAGFKVVFTLVVSNTGGAPVNILEISPWVDAIGDTFANVPTALESLKVVAISGKTQIPAAGSLTFSWPAVYFASPDKGGLKQPWSYPAGVSVRTDDGSVTQSNVLGIAVTTPQPYVLGLNPGQYPQMPTPGQLRFESNQNSGLIPLILGH